MFIFTPEAKVMNIQNLAANTTIVSGFYPKACSQFKFRSLSVSMDVHKTVSVASVESPDYSCFLDESNPRFLER